MRTVADLWAAVHERPEFSIIRRRLAQPMQEYSSSGTNGAIASEGDCSSPAKPSADSSAGAGSMERASFSLPTSAPPVQIVASISEALELLRSDARAAAAAPVAAGVPQAGHGSSPDASRGTPLAVTAGDGKPARPLRVLVTGSLYLVGGVLQGLGWREDAH